MQEPGGPELKRAWSAMAAFLCCIPWLAVTFMHQREALVVALQDRNLCIAALLSGAPLARSQALCNALCVSLCSACHIDSCARLTCTVWQSARVRK